MAAKKNNKIYILTYTEAYETCNQFEAAWKNKPSTEEVLEFVSKTNEGYEKLRLPEKRLKHFQETGELIMCDSKWNYAGYQLSEEELR